MGTRAIFLLPGLCIGLIGGESCCIFAVSLLSHGTAAILFSNYSFLFSKGLKGEVTCTFALCIPLLVWL